MESKSAVPMVSAAYDSFTVDAFGRLTGAVDDSGMTRFEGHVEADGSFSTKYLRMPGTSSGKIWPDGSVSGKSAVRGRESSFSGRLLFKETKQGACAYMGEYDITYLKSQRPQGSAPVDASDTRAYLPRGSSPIGRRGIKFNLPLDLRTPSYSDGGDCAQLNIETVWDMQFWKDFLQRMEHMGYNTLSLWNLNPFPSLVKVPEYPLIALDDVWRTKAEYDDSINGRATNLVQDVHLERHEVLLTLTIEEKIRFWQDVMALAHHRGIEVYLFFWNIYTFAEQGKYGITHSMDNPVTKDYFRASVRQLIRTYPDLDGIGIACGEQMSDRPGSEAANEQWLWETYGLGICDALGEMPERSFRLIHRLHLTDFSLTEQIWKNLPCPMDYSDKYSGAHMLSGTKPSFIDPTIRALPKGRKLWLEVRSDDLYLQRWADPAYVREYLQHMPDNSLMEGFLLGADGYTPAREFCHRDSAFSGELFLDRHWLLYTLFGQLAKSPLTEDSHFLNQLHDCFPTIPEAGIQALWSALCSAGKIIPQVSRLYFQANDAPWYPEGCLSHPYMFGYLDIRRWAKSKNAMPGGGCLSIKAYSDILAAGNACTSSKTPPEVAAALLSHADQVDLYAHNGWKAVSGLPASREVRAYLNLLQDQQAMAFLGRYYAEKITAAVHLNLLTATASEDHRQRAVEALEKALGYWKEYARLFHSQYLPQRLPRHGILDLNAMIPLVEKDISTVQNIPIR